MRTPLRLRTALTPLLHQQALLTGSVQLADVVLEPLDIRPYVEAFRRMARTDDLDLCELSVMTYLIGRELGRPWSAIPVFPRHAFHHRDFVVNVHSQIRHPQDLVGRRVGTRNWTVTPGVLDRGILTDLYDVDLSGITWVLAEDEHLPESAARRPANVESAPSQDLFEELVSGELPAGIAGANLARRESDQLAPLFPDFAALDATQYARTGVVPPFTVIVVHDRVLAERPALLEELYAAFVSARADGLEPGPGVAQIVADDPVPIGLERNRAGLQELLRLGHEQAILTSDRQLEDLFPPFN